MSLNEPLEKKLSIRASGHIATSSHGSESNLCIKPTCQKLDRAQNHGRSVSLFVALSYLFRIESKCGIFKFMKQTKIDPPTKFDTVFFEIR